MEEGIAETVTRLVLGLAIILFAAKLGGEVAQRFLRQPSVLGELLSGIIIGPYALGALSIPGIGALFPLPHGAEAESFISVSPELWSFAQVASVILLFLAGLETDLRQFLRFAPRAILVATGGLLFPFLLGDYGMVFLGVAEGPLAPEALFVGAMLTATSVGVTARVLADIQKINTPEGVTVLAAAVIDDVLAILILTIVVGVSVTGGVSASNIALVGGKAIGFWLALMAAGILTARLLSRLLLGFQSAGAALALSLGLAFLAAALAEMFGLAMIIGAYTIGLALSGTELKERLEEPLRAVYQALVPIFFVVMGMLVNLAAMGDVLAFGLIITFLAILGKLVGAALPALASGFNLLGAWRIGVGMLPRAEVVLIIAGAGLSRGIIGPGIFGVAIMVVVTTMVLTPVLLVPSFRRGGHGLRSMAAAAEASEE